MIDFKPFIEDGMVEGKVHGKLESVDFKKIAPVVDEMIEHRGKSRDSCSTLPSMRVGKVSRR